MKPAALLALLAAFACVLAAQHASEDDFLNSGAPPKWPGRTLLWTNILRHGTRSPGDPPPSLGRSVNLYNFSTRQFPPWVDSSSKHPAGNGALTPHGFAALQNIGEWFRRFAFGDDSFQCEDGFYYVDSSTRCLDSATAFWTGFSPACNIDYVVQPANSSAKKYPGRTLFKHVTGGIVDLPQCHGNTDASIGGGSIARRQNWMVDLHRDALTEINKQLTITPGICNKTSGSCSLFEVPLEDPDWTDTSFLRGPYGYGDYFANYFQTQYYDGQEVAWDAFKTDELGFLPMSRIFEVHTMEDHFQSRNGASALSFGIECMAHMLATFDQAVHQKDLSQITSLHHPWSKKIVSYMGHHETVMYFSYFLDTLHASLLQELFWAPFGSGFYFRLYEDTVGSKTDQFIDTYFITSTADQQRFSTVLDFGKEMPAVERVFLPWCTSSNSFVCRYSDFKAYLLTKFQNKCIYDHSLFKWAWTEKQRTYASELFS